MSRQRIRTGVLESTTTTCPVCHGTGHVRAPSSVALHVLRSLEDQLLKGVTHNLTIRTRTQVALYILNQKRAHISELEQRFGLTIAVVADETITNGAHFIIERGEPVSPREPVSTTVQPDSVQPVVEEIEAAEAEADLEIEEEEDEEESVETIGGEEREERGRERYHGHGENGGSEDGGRRRRRRRRRRGGGGEGHREPGHGEPMMARGSDEKRAADALNREEREPEGERQPQRHGELDEHGQPRRRRRGRRGGRRGRGRDQRPENGGQPYHGDAPRHGRPREERETEYAEAPRSPASAEEREQRPAEEVPVYRSEPIPEPRPEPQFKHVERPVDESPPEETPAPAPRRYEPEPEVEDPNRPKRGGWWQRRSFL
jgi:ribonuclease E